MKDAPPQFAVIPDVQELASMERDLRFHPTINPSPKVLTADQIDRFNQQGFLQPLPVFSGDDIGTIRSYFDDLLAEYIQKGQDSYSISSAHLCHGRVWDILTDKRIVSLVADLLGDNVVGWGSHFFCKLPHDGKSVAWHQDASYWPLSPSKAVTVWLAIDDADTQNACVQFVAGSHHSGHLTYRESKPEDHNVLNQTIDRPEQFGTICNNILRAGEVSLHSDLLLHGSDANQSDRRRCGLTLRYASADVRAGLGWNEKGVIVQGRDASGHWSNRPRPDVA